MDMNEINRQSESITDTTPEKKYRHRSVPLLTLIVIYYVVPRVYGKIWSLWL